MTHSVRSWMRVGFVPAALILLVASCSSDGGPGERGGPSGPRRKPPTPMAGHESFFDGRILAEISVGTEGLPQGGEGGGSRGGEGRRGGGGSGGGRLNIAGGSGGIGGNIGGGIPFGGGGGEGRSRHGGYGEGGGPIPGPRMMGGGMGRPVMIHLRFTNQGPAAVTLVIDDFSSPLGNFAVRPEKLVLEPGQSLETEPMTSQLAGEYSEANATLVLRVGPKAEKKTFTIKAANPPAEQPK